MEPHKILYLSKADVAQAALDMPAVIALVETAFREKAAGNVEMPPKMGIHPAPDGFSHAMPAYIPAMQAAGMKWISSYPTNLERGLPNIHGLLILNEPETGVPVAVMDCTWITAARTGAASALSARYLARPESSTAGIIACGVQGRSNLEALSALFPLEQVFAFDPQPDVLARFAAEMSARLGIEIVGVKTPREAVEGCDLVVTSGPIQRKAQPTIGAGWLKPGGFASSVDFGSYWSAESLAEMAQIATDDLAQYQAYRQMGYFDHIPEPHTDLAGLVAGRAPGRQTASERTIAINLGLALEDIAVAPEVYRRARAQGLGTWVDL